MSVASTLRHRLYIVVLLLSLSSITVSSQTPPSVATTEEVVGLSLDQKNRAVEILRSADERGEATFGLSVWDVTASEPEVDYEARTAKTPASVTKIFSTASALISLGADYQFPTEIGIRGEISDEGVLTGDLIVVGHGDPSIESRFYPDRRAGLSSQIKEELDKLGVKKIVGRIIVDASALCNEGYLSVWPKRHWGLRYATPVYGFNTDDNVMQVGISAQDLARGATQPTYLQPKECGNVWTLDIHLVKRGNKLSVSTDNNSKPRRTLSGSLARGGSQRVTISTDLSSPADAGAAQIKSYLADRGVDLSECRAEGCYDKPTPQMSRLLTIYLSPSLKSLIRVCNVHSHNLYAEAIARSIHNKWGVVNDQYCISAQSATRWIEDYWRAACHLPKEELKICDGSGLSDYNRISPYALTATLRHIYQMPAQLSDAFILSLPQVGVEGTVKNLFPSSKITAYLKSGSISSVQNYAGYVSYHGHTYCVAIMANQIKNRAKARRSMVQALEALFAAY